MFSMDRRRILQIVVGLVALHSIALGGLNWLFTANWMRIMRMPISSGAFWPRQSGAFLISLGFAYGLGCVVPRYLQMSTLVIILSKSVALVFLFPEFFLRDAPLAILLAGLGDLCMLIVVSILAWWVYRYSASREKSEREDVLR